MTDLVKQLREYSHGIKHNIYWAAADEITRLQTHKETVIAECQRVMKERDALQAELAKRDTELGQIVAQQVASYQAEVAKLRDFLAEVGKATRIEWWDDVVNDPASWVAGVLDSARD